MQIPLFLKNKRSRLTCKLINLIELHKYLMLQINYNLKKLTVAIVLIVQAGSDLAKILCRIEKMAIKALVIFQALFRAALRIHKKCRPIRILISCSLQAAPSNVKTKWRKLKVILLHWVLLRAALWNAMRMVQNQLSQIRRNRKQTTVHAQAFQKKYSNKFLLIKQISNQSILTTMTKQLLIRQKKIEIS